jgi:type III restriction enzyme
LGRCDESPVHVILETKGYDPLESVKRAAAERWVAAVNAEGSYGSWAYRIAKKTTEVSGIISAASNGTEADRHKSV